MTRVPVPDAHERDYVEIRAERDLGPDDFVVGSRRADVVVSGETARTAKVREDEDGRYVGVYEEYAPAVAAFFNEAYDAGLDPSDYAPDSDDTETDEVPVADLVEMGVCPWCDDYDGGHVGQHASSKHPEAWTAYKDEEGEE